MKRLAIYCVVLEIALGMTIGVAQVTTSQYDNRRTGATLNEKTLTPTKCECRAVWQIGGVQSGRRSIRAAVVRAIGRDSWKGEA